MVQIDPPLKYRSMRTSNWKNPMNNSEENRRVFLLEALTAGVFTGITAAGILYPAYALSTLPDRLPKGQSIYRLSGEVTVNGMLANMNTIITPNSVIRTGADGEIIFVVASDAFILRENSELELTASGLLLKSMRILSGAVLSVFGKREAPHQIVTTTATIGIRGTGIYVESGIDKSYVCTCYGHTNIAARADPSVVKDIITTHHDKPVYILSSAAKKKLIVRAPVINHSDKELALVEALVGRKTPFGGVGYSFREGKGGGY